MEFPRRLAAVVAAVAMCGVVAAQNGPPATAAPKSCEENPNPKRCRETTTTTTVAPVTTTTTVAPTTTVAATTTTVPATTTTIPPGRELLWVADDETDYLTDEATRDWRRRETKNGNPSRFQIVDDPHGLYGKVYRAQLTPEEIAAGDRRAEFAVATVWPEDERLELGVSNSLRGSTENVYFSWQSMFGPDVFIDSDHSNNGNYMQLKGNSSCGGPAVGLTIKYGRLTLRSEQFLTEHSHIAWNGPEMSTLFDRWHEFVLHVNFSKDETVGYVELWFNGEPQLMSNGETRIHFPTMCPNDDYVFPKLGVYSFDGPAPGDGPVHWFNQPRVDTSR